jgi:hypothetical protein
MQFSAIFRTFQGGHDTTTFEKKQRKNAVETINTAMGYR